MLVESVHCQPDIVHDNNVYKAILKAIDVTMLWNGKGLACETTTHVTLLM